ncbi:hypothetical protein [Treponema sp. SP13]|uniref:hypothetical protein n=1 Tax=Treponema sp. SP13 TaxID=2789742 RepID=UPI003D8BF3C0
MKKGNGFVTVLCRNPTYLKCFSQKDKNLHKEIDDAIRPYGAIHPYDCILRREDI